MKFCMDHWDKLKKAIDDRGLTHLVAKSSEEVIENIVGELNQEPTSYDPLMSCHWMIMSQAIEQGGLYLLMVKEDGTDYCPICEAVKNGEIEESWIDGPADAALHYCRESKLIPPLS